MDRPFDPDERDDGLVDDGSSVDLFDFRLLSDGFRLVFLST